MSGTNDQRALFANAPVLPAPQQIPTVPAGSNLAAAMMQQNNRPMNLQTPGMNIPLASMMSMANANKANPTPGNNQTGLVRGPDGSWVAGPTMGGDIPTLSYVQENIPTQGLAPGMPGGGAPGMPTMGAPAPGMPSGSMPGTPSMGAPGTPGANQPGLFGQTMNWLQSIGGGAPGGGYSGGGG